MKLTKLLAIVIVISGILVLGIGLFQLWDMKRQEQASLKAARELVKEDRKSVKNEEFKPETGETSGLLLIPKIEAELPIVEGTEPDDLEKGVGHFKDSFYPDENGQIVLSGHRDTVFRKAGDLKVGDLLTVKMPYGDYSYEIVSTKIVSADDTSIITLQNNEEELVLTTCYPFSYVGDAPDRYIIYAKRIAEGN
ncbi:class D sortase [Mesobacillus sp. AQ2]|uniref:class D sortase n=1 Tax=Bacillaceae TaxID=186817 RepID=UPI0011A8B201|nr:MULTISPECIES: class D sortase [Bacillaceae]MCM3122630.1 class D sortase [Mesobacillus sp. MER 33]MCM3232594.1 class D sortase [Mesobacillus sp. MER 48]WHX39525.1 class D sortase [Mesobacillus sp. AQ2]